MLFPERSSLSGHAAGNRTLTGLSFRSLWRLEGATTLNWWSRILLNHPRSSGPRQLATGYSSFENLFVSMTEYATEPKPSLSVFWRQSLRSITFRYRTSGTMRKAKGILTSVKVTHGAFPGPHEDLQERQEGKIPYRIAWLPSVFLLA